MSGRDEERESFEEEESLNRLGEDAYLAEESEEEEEEIEEEERETYADKENDFEQININTNINITTRKKEKKKRKEKEKEEEENEVLKEYLQGEKILNEEEKKAEEEGEDLFAGDAKRDDTFIVGQFDDARERMAYENMGMDPDIYERDFIDSEEEEVVFDEKFYKAKRAAEKRMKYRDKILQQQNTHTHKNNLLSAGLQKLLEEEDEEELEQVEQRRRARREALSRAAVNSDLPDLNNLHAAKRCLASGYLEGGLDERQTEALVTCFRYFIHKFILNKEEEKNNNNNNYVNEEEDVHTQDTSQDNLKNDKNDMFPHYLNAIHKMINEDKCSLHVSTRHLIQFHCANLVHWIEHKPSRVLELLDITLTEEVRALSRIYEARSCRVCLSEWPFKTQLRNLRANDLNTLVNCSGVVTRRGAVLPKLKVLYLSCLSCGVTLNEQPVYFSDNAKPQMPKRCVYCQRSSFVPDRISTVYQDFQRLTIQESPGSVPAGRAPRQRELLVVGELVDKVKPGEEVEVLGIYQTKYDVVLNIKMGFPVFATQILCNNISRKEDVRIGELTEEDIAEIKRLSRDPNITERIIASIAPSIWGHREVKVALAYALFGGVCKGKNIKNTQNNNMYNNTFNTSDIIMHSSGGGGDYRDGGNANSSASSTMAGGHSIRGDINVLLIGDPGLGKSQALQYVHKTFHRTVCTTGKGASAVGLTAGVRRDAATGEWTLEGGALVLADEGICLIDEFDKMTEKDRVSIHEAMEQQSISISKAGIVTQLRARCSVIAAANPKYGRYEPSLTFKENVELSDPILSRFDIIAVMRDIPNVDIDSSIGDYVVANHMRYHPLINTIDAFDSKVKQLETLMTAHQTFQPIPQSILQKYILYARNNCRPSLDQLPQGNLREKLSSFYARLRQRVSVSGGFSMTLRHIESMIRIAEANAKMRLSHSVTNVDVDRAIATILDSFISSQKYAVAAKLSKEFARYRAVARGGMEALSEICSRCIQLNIKRNTILNKKHTSNKNKLAGGEREEEGEGEEGEKEKRQQDDDDAYEELQNALKYAKLPFTHFKKAALENKFTDYNIESWLKSKAFHEHYLLIQEGGEDFITTKRFYQPQ